MVEICKLPNSSWVVVDAVYKQDIVLIKENGDQVACEMNCIALKFGKIAHIQYPRSIFRGKVKYWMLKYSEKQDVVFYKKATRQENKTGHGV